MSKQTINTIVDAAAFIALLFLAATGSLIKFVLPPGTGHFNVIWGMDRHEWGEVHYVFAIVFLTAMACHLFMHWHWILFTVQGRSSKQANLRTAAAVLGLAVLLGLAASPYLARVESTSEAPHKKQAEKCLEDKTCQELPMPKKQAEKKHAEESPSPVDGTMTLAEVERKTGVSAALILKEMKLPADVPMDERLGRLRKKYNFDMHELRAIVEKNTTKPAGVK